MFGPGQYEVGPIFVNKSMDKLDLTRIYRLPLSRMATSSWQQRILATTRGRVISLLRTGSMTVNDLAAALGLTDNAVRTHLAALERDSLVRQRGVRRAVGKPAFVYELTAEADALFPKAYAPILARVLTRIREEKGEKGLETFLRSVGYETGEVARVEGTLRQRIDAAVALLGELGGLVEVEEREHAYLLNGYSCPLREVVGNNPEACTLAEEIVAGVVSAEVRECCDRSDPPRCRFRIAKASE